MGTDSTTTSKTKTPAPAEPPPPAAPPVPVELCGYTVDSPLTPGGGTYLCIGPGGRGVVLKRMADECLLRGLLHPSIRDRLSRVRELAHAGLANLHGVGREGTEAWLIWEYVEGRTFDEYVAADSRTPRELAVLGHELALTVEALHGQGVVHGALSGTNVLVSPSGTVRLTHVSPLLYDDPAADSIAVVELMQLAVERRGGYKSRWPLARLLDEAAEEAWPLRVLAARLARLIESRPGHHAPASTTTLGSREFGGPRDFGTTRRREDGGKSRRRALAAAALVSALGLAAAYGAWHTAGQPGKPKIRQWLSQGMERLR